MRLTAPTGSKVLVVDDEQNVREVLCAYLDRGGFEVTEAADGRAALQAISDHEPDLVLLDLMLPGIDGLSVLGEIRRENPIPVILLTALAEESDRVVGLEMGADDYVVKPFSPREVTARVKAVLKRVAEPDQFGDRLQFEDLSIDGRTREVRVREETVELTPKEFDLLAFLASSPRQVFSRGQLLEHVWGSSREWQDPSTVTVHVGRIRQKIETYPNHPRWITTVWGVGYRFEP
jgi:DNA-binding response OmpR family regulator